jgi:hypothetical protein
MFSSTVTGDDYDPQIVTNSGLNIALQNYSTNIALGEVQTTVTTALTQSLGNTSVISALDQRVTSELAGKLTVDSLSPYALQTDLTQANINIASTSTSLLSTQLNYSTLQTSLSNSLSLKADQSDLEATNLILQSAVTNGILEAQLIPYSTTTSMNQSIAISKGSIEATAAATFATQQMLTSLSVEVAGKPNQNDITTALNNYSTTDLTSTAITTATDLLETQIQTSITTLQNTANTHSTQLLTKASESSVLQLTSDLSSKVSTSELVLALTPYATTSALSALQSALTQLGLTIPIAGITPTELNSLLLGYVTTGTYQSLNSLVLQLQSDLATKVSQANVNATLAAYVTTSTLQSVQASIQSSINAILASMGNNGGTSLELTTELDLPVSILMKNKQNGFDNIYKFVLEDYANGSALLALYYQLPGNGNTLQKAIDFFAGNMQLYGSLTTESLRAQNGANVGEMGPTTLV